MILTWSNKPPKTTDIYLSCCSKQQRTLITEPWIYIYIYIGWFYRHRRCRRRLPSKQDRAECHIAILTINFLWHERRALASLAFVLGNWNLNMCNTIYIYLEHEKGVESCVSHIVSLCNYKTFHLLFAKPRYIDDIACTIRVVWFDLWKGGIGG